MTGVRLTPADVEAVIRSEFYFTAAEGVLGESAMGTQPAGSAEHLKRLTICVLVLSNGFTVLGHSACADPTIYDKQKGRERARDQAVSKIWPLLGYELNTKLRGLGIAGSSQ